MKECSWCSNYFEPATTFQIYCGPECRVLATKQKIKDRSRIMAIRKRAKQKRMCINGCGTQLSMYNSGKICNVCQVNDRLVNKALSNMKDFFDIEDQT